MDNPYSKIQHFFWLWSGVEISILKDCPTDFNRQAGIGFTIFMTTLLAFFSGSYAGWYFGESYITAIVFGTIWSALIFSIDRSMVTTLKKDPDAPKQNFWPPFLSRAVLALLIAFVISIPLELLIFQEEIEANMLFFKEKQTGRVIDLKAKNIGLGQKQQQYVRDSIDAEAAARTAALPQPVQDVTYNNLVETYNRLSRQYNNLQGAYNKAKANASFNLSRIPIIDGQRDMSSNEALRYVRSKVISDKKFNELRKFDRNSLNKANDDKALYLTNWHKENQERQALAEQTKSKRKLAIDTALSIQATTGKKQANLTEGNKGFITRFMVLEDLASVSNQKDNPSAGTVFFLLWLIRIMFFIIEVLPTIAKISTPIGAYDIAIKAKERDIEQDLKDRTKEYLAHQHELRFTEYDAVEKQGKDRIKIESNLHKRLIQEIAEVQGAIARQKLAEFRKLHIKAEASSFIDMIWYQKNTAASERTEYFFKNGSLGENQRLLIFSGDKTITGTWSYKNNGTSLEIMLPDKHVFFKIQTLDDDRFELQDEGSLESIYLEKTKSITI